MRDRFDSMAQHIANDDIMSEGNHKSLSQHSHSADNRSGRCQILNQCTFGQMSSQMSVVPSRQDRRSSRQSSSSDSDSDSDCSMRSASQSSAKKGGNASELQTLFNKMDLPGKQDSENPSGNSRLIGPLTDLERREKVRNYFVKKRCKHGQKKFSYTCRKQVADKRLRIKGRFVTKEQAFEILGLTQNELLDNEMIQQLLTQYADDPMQMNSLIESQKNGGQLIKVRNF